MDELKRFEGCLLGGAAGDALGYPVEFMLAKEIFAKYGPQGITQYELKDGVAQISDDTQMTLFTANGLILFKMSGCHIIEVGYEAEMYKEWFLTQTHTYPLAQSKYYSWLLNIPEMFAKRAPGLTCMAELEKINIRIGRIELSENDSKGCGGVMRVAPVGLFLTREISRLKRVDRMAAACARITHGHELGYIPAAALAHIIGYLLLYTEANIEDAVKDAIEKMKEIYVDAKYLQDFVDIMNKAVYLAEQDCNDLEAISQLGEGWVAEETLAISVYCAIKYQNDFDKALIAAVNHDGDSDSTGAITGNIVGVRLGIGGIPDKYKENLELKKVILTMADDLYYAKYKRINDNASRLPISKYGKDNVR